VVIQPIGAASSAESAEQLKKAESKKISDEQLAKSSPTAYSEDTTSLTSATDSVKKLTQTALAEDPVRAARVQSLKQAVSQGEYSLEAAEIAASLSSATI
jgi:flagellar biosynthesis anti-sigma factor FlgM